MKIVFRRRRKTLFSWLVWLWTGSIHTHCEILLPGNLMISAVESGGVRRVYVLEWFDPAVWDIVDIPLTPAQEAAVELWAEGEIGCAYDWLGILLCQVLPLGRQHKDKWFCSEFCVAALQSVGLLPGVKAHNHHPGSLFKLLKGLGYEVH